MMVWILICTQTFSVSMDWVCWLLALLAMLGLLIEQLYRHQVNGNCPISLTLMHLPFSEGALVAGIACNGGRANWTTLQEAGHISKSTVSSEYRDRAWIWTPISFCCNILMQIKIFLINRICWLLILVVMMGVSIEQLYKRLDTFLKVPLAVNIEIKHEQEVRFPSIVICNENPSP